MFGNGSDLWRSSRPTSLLNQIHLKQVSQDHIQVNLPIVTLQMKTEITVSVQVTVGQLCLFLETELIRREQDRCPKSPGASGFVSRFCRPCEGLSPCWPAGRSPPAALGKHCRAVLPKQQPGNSAADAVPRCLPVFLVFPSPAGFPGQRRDAPAAPAGSAAPAPRGTATSPGQPGQHRRGHRHRLPAPPGRAPLRLETRDPAHSGLLPR
ncbi:translation initiation factor IF-2-like [Corvus hawaiiensis]|uniref:translation initiation factor IF-2-like n=1 Tax=Corvus hawaiiensis TaxID=134902 RepID=UPI002019E069|nr:translation initiation factor IF-2-like [Corvus hawaiiensis]XP_048147889.1 translation initiation factor IF-2-like [Corvus hawaiiensis]